MMAPLIKRLTLSDSSVIANSVHVSGAAPWFAWCAEPRVENASGDLVARHDHDDISDPLRLEQQVAYLEANPDVALVGSRAWLIDEEGKRIGRLDRCLDGVNPLVSAS